MKPRLELALGGASDGCPASVVRFWLSNSLPPWGVLLPLAGTTVLCVAYFKSQKLWGKVNYKRILKTVSFHEVAHTGKVMKQSGLEIQARALRTWEQSPG